MDAGYIPNIPVDASYIPNFRGASENILHHESVTYRTKEYPVELKPLFSAFGLKSFAITSLRSFLLFYLPLLGPRPPVEEEDDDFLEETSEDKHVDLVVPFKNSVKQIFREVIFFAACSFLIHANHLNVI